MRPGQGPPAVVIPYHSRGDLLPLAAGSVGPLPLVVVDDSPSGAPPLALRGLAPVEVVRTAGGQGFARAANAGLRAAEGHGFGRVLLLNDDAVLLPGTVEALQRAMDASSAVAVAGPVILDMGGQLESAGISVSRRTGRVTQIRRPPPRDVSVDALSGACLLMESSWRFDEAYRFGFEDIELCGRVRDAGRRVLLVSGARCLHMGGGTVSRRSSVATRHAVAGHLRLFGGAPWLAPPILIMAALQVLREGGGVERFRAIGRGWADMMVPSADEQEGGTTPAG